MKKNNYIVIAAILGTLLTSCAHTYQFCQICETRPVQEDNLIQHKNGELVYENSQCIIGYNLWSNGGNVDFEFYNKTDEIIYIDLTKSFFVRNNESYDLYLNREWSQSSTIGHASSLSYGYGESRSVELSMGRIEPAHTPFGDVSVKAAGSASRSANIASNQAMAYSKSNAVTIKEKPIIAVPPHSKKYISAYNITTTPMPSCKIPRYPASSAKLDFTLDDTPLCFSNIITYTIGNSSQPITVNNKFYVSSVTNYAEPEIAVMKRREDICENMRNPDNGATSYELYDKVIRDSICETASSFYNTYSITTKKELYQDKSLDGYTYNTQYQAYTNSNLQSSQGSQSSAKAKGVVTGVIAMAVGTALVLLLGTLIEN